MLQKTTNDVVDKLATKSQDMRQRRTVNAGDAVDAQDYTTLNDLNTRLQPSAYIDTTDASNITKGILSSAQLPFPSARNLGGILSLTPVAHKYVTGLDTKGNLLTSSITISDFPSDPAVANQFVTSINTGGVVLRAQPAFSNLSGLIAPAQVPVSLKPPTTQTVPSRAIGATYQNTQVTPIYISAGFLMQPGATDNLGFYCDASASPTTLVANAFATTPPQSFVIQLFVLVLPNYFYRTALASGTVFINTWIEWF